MIIGSLSNLDKLEPYNPDNDFYALFEASLNGLGLSYLKKTARAGLEFYRLVPLL